MRIFITGGAGFIGSALARRMMADASNAVLVYDKLTYAGDRRTLEGADADGRCGFVQGDICDRAALDAALAAFQPDAIAHLAAESHVDRSIDGPTAFIETNLVGTYHIAQAALNYWRAADDAVKARFRLLHVSTDEVFGALGPIGKFTETTAYDPRSPYSASKAGSDHLISAWRHTYGLPAMISNCSNNYGPYHFPEKLIPLMILNALHGEPLPVYGDGQQVRDWLHVDDHVAALETILRHGAPGETYMVGGDGERTNLAVVQSICDILDEVAPPLPAGPRRGLIRFVEDRPGHDRRYAVDSTKLKTQLGWAPARSFEQGLRDTIAWYLANEDYWRPIRARTYKGERLGLAQQQKAPS
jgi:dTDP-glucose 4,6-dehydratase